MIKIDVNTASYEEVSKLYASFWKKLPADLVTKECRDVAIKATMFTKFTPKDKVEQELEAPSKVNPNAPLKDILAARDGVTPAQLKRQRLNSTNAVRAGFANGARQFKELNRGGGFVPRLRSSKKMGGGTLSPSNPSIPSTTSTGKIYNSFGGSDPVVRAYQVKGLEGAKNAVKADRIPYCLKKLEQIKNKVGAWK